MGLGVGGKGFETSGLGCKGWGLGFRVIGGSRISVPRFRVEGLGFWILYQRPRDPPSRPNSAMENASHWALRTVSSTSTKSEWGRAGRKVLRSPSKRSKNAS